MKWFFLNIYINKYDLSKFDRIKKLKNVFFISYSYLQECNHCFKLIHFYVKMEKFLCNNKKIWRWGRFKVFILCTISSLLFYNPDGYPYFPDRGSCLSFSRWHTQWTFIKIIKHNSEHILLQYQFNLTSYSFLFNIKIKICLLVDKFQFNASQTAVSNG